MLNRMPDENTNPVGVTQTSQNDQATTNQSWDDFVLDFWVGNKNEETSEWVEISGVVLDETNNEGESWSSSSEIDLWFANDTHEWDSQENNINIQDLDSLLNEDKNEGFDVSLGDSKQNDAEKEKSNEEKENNEEQQDVEKQQDDNDVTSVQTDEEKIINSNQETEEKTSEEILDLNNNLEENKEDNNSPEFVETNEIQDNQDIEEKLSKNTLWDLQENTSQWDDFSISFDDNANLSEKSDNNLDKNISEEGVNEDSDKENQNTEMGVEEKSEIWDEENHSTDLEVSMEEETINEKENTQEINLETTEKEDEEKDLSPNQWDSLDDKTEEKSIDETSFSEIWENNEANNNLAEVSNDEDYKDESPVEIPVNEEIKDNNEEIIEETKIDNENLENQDNKPEDFVMSFDLENDVDSQSAKQPNTWDSLINPLLDSPIDENNEKNIENESDDMIKETSITESLTDMAETIPNQEVSQNEITQETQESNNTEIQEFTLDYVDDENNKQEEKQDNGTTDNVDNITETQSEPELTQSSENSKEQESSTLNLDDIVTSTNNSSQEPSIEGNKVDGEKQEVEVNNVNESIIPENVEEKPNNEIKDTGIATLSLDQILDSELNSNPQYADNSKAVPKNVPLNSWFFNKKTVWIMAVVLILAGFVAVLAFPSKKSGEKEWEVVQYTWYDTEEEHYVWDDPVEDTGEYLEAEIKNIIDDTLYGEESTMDVKHDNPKIDEFPDREYWEDDIEHPVLWEDTWETNTETVPEPYTCLDDECTEDVEETEEEIIITAEEIESTISKFKSEAEKYYTLWDENQDKKIIKYALQIINLCDNYQWEIENGEQKTQTSFNEFKSKIIWIESKIEKYIGWGDEVETFVQPNFNDEYGWDWKEEMQDFINNRDNYY